MIRLLILLISMGLTTVAWGVTCSSRDKGNWNAQNTWACGSGSENGPPNAGDDVVIGHAVKLNTSTPLLASLTIQASGSLTDTGNDRTINLAGNLSNDGTVDLGGSNSSVVLGGGSNWRGSGSLRADYLDINWKSLVLDSAAAMTIRLANSDPFRNVGGFNNAASANRLATVYLDGSTQTYDDYHLKMPNLVLGGGMKTVSSSGFVVLGNLTINSGATLSTNSVSTVSVGGNLTIDGTLSSFSGGSSIWTFDGSSVQHVSAAASFRSVVLDNPAGLSLGGNLTIGDSSWGALTLSRGKLTTNSHSVIVPKNCSGSAMSRSAGSWINGNLQLTMPAWATSCIFDVGDSANYAPITVAYPWHDSPLGGTVTGATLGGDHPDTLSGSSGIDSLKSVNRYWVLSAGSGAKFYGYDAIFQYCSTTGSADCSVNDVDSGALASNFVVAEKTAGWSSGAPTAPTANSRKLSGLGAFGIFAIGEAGTVSRCSQPSNTPAGLTLTCQCDTFGRAALNPSPMFANGNWTVSTSDSTGVVPYIHPTTKLLRLTDLTNNNAKAATAPGFFPAAGNYLSVEIKHYAYGGSAADGMVVVLSDYSVPAVPGAFGGSLGYANRNGVSGFAGGWIGVGLDEYGNFSNANEGRHGGIGFISDGVAVRGSGSGQSGYPYLGGTSGGLVPGVDNAGSTSPAPGHYYQIVVDDLAEGKAKITVNRDTTGTGAGYSQLFQFDPFAAATAAGYTQASVPTNLQLSLTGSTGDSINIHEVGEVRICALYYVPPDGGTAGRFSAIDDFYDSTIQNFQSGHIFTKLVGTAFALKVAALANDQIQTSYAAGATKNVSIKLVDNSDGLCGSDAERVSACANSACNGKVAVSGGSQTLAFTSADKGIKTTANFTLNSAYANLVAVISEGGVTACSVDTFAVRPTRFSGVSSSADNASLVGSPKFKAGTDSFTLTATTNADGYFGTPKINTAAMSSTASGWVVGSFSETTFPAATAVSSGSAASGSFTYSEVGNFRFTGYDPAKDEKSARGIYDDSWVAVDSAATKKDCVAGSYANTKDSTGKYGCLFGLQDTGASAPDSAMFGRFVPDHFDYSSGAVSQFCSSGTQPFSYMGQPAIGVVYRLQAMSGGGTVTTNYSEALGYPVSNPILVAEDQLPAHQGCDLSSRLSGLASSSKWTAGIFAFNDADANGAPDEMLSFSRPANPVALTTASCAANRASAGGPFLSLDLGVMMNDADAGATMSSLDMDAANTGSCVGAACTAHTIGRSGVLNGRLQLSNAYGSELLTLKVPAKLQYWTAAGWVKNEYDGCTALTVPTPANSGLSNTQSNRTTARLESPTIAGDSRLRLSAPGAGNTGLVDISGSVLLGANFWLNLPVPTARACFGACGPRSPVIYLRERY